MTRLGAAGCIDYTSEDVGQRTLALAGIVLAVAGS